MKLSQDVHANLWDSYSGKVFLSNLTCQIEAGVVDEKLAQQIIDELNHSNIATIHDFWNLVGVVASPPSIPLQASDYCPDSVDYQTLIRISPMKNIFDAVNLESCPSLDYIKEIFNGHRSFLEGEFYSLNRAEQDEKLKEYEDDLFSDFDAAVDLEESHGKPTWKHGAHPWIGCTLNTNIKLNDEHLHYPTFCTSTSKDHTEYEMFKNRTLSADMARDLLGLAFFDNTRLGSLVALGAISFDYKDFNSLPQPKVTRPTVVDMVDEKRFKGAFGTMRSKSDGWGRAVDLSKIGAERPHRGGRELVLQAQKISNVRVTFLGYLRLPRNDTYHGNDDLDMQFLNDCLRGRTSIELMNELCT